jgi:hypothetical protein
MGKQDRLGKGPSKDVASAGTRLWPDPMGTWSMTDPQSRSHLEAGVGAFCTLTPVSRCHGLLVRGVCFSLNKRVWVGPVSICIQYLPENGLEECGSGARTLGSPV